ncbi:MAG: T9SS type A sorting domain-containing protein [Bacteroidales bacterium]|nr:T9SS type A sorting domain-containing protein [Bacteroidales bacterium]
MKKTILLFVLLSGLVGLSNVFSQDMRAVLPLQKNKEALHRVNNQHKNLSGFNNQTPFKTGEKGLVWKPDTIIIYNITNLEKRYTYTYDGNGYSLTMLEEQWESGTWENYQRYTYTYDNNGNMLTNLSELWQNGAWMNSFKATFTYDDNGNELSYLFKRWLNGAWANERRHTHIYDGNGNMLTRLIEKWESGVWVNDYRHTHTYDDNENILTILAEQSESNNWRNYYRDTYTYDDRGNVATYIHALWQINEWNNYQRYTYTYDDNGNILTLLVANALSNEWMNSVIYTCTYDDIGNRLAELCEQWQSNELVYYNRIAYTYDDNGNSVTGMFEEWQSGTWQPGASELELYSYQNSFLKFYGLHRYEASFISFTTDVVSVKDDNSIAIYPNPATDLIFLSLSNFENTIVEIFNIQGQLCQSLNLQSNETEINIANLPKGLYLLKVKSPTKIEVRKFIKE